MTKIEKCVVGMGVCITGLLLVAVAAFNGSSDKTLKSASQNSAAAGVAATSQNQTPAFGQTPALQPASRTSSQVVSAPIDPLPANSTYVPDGNLQQLSTMVNLAEAVNQQPDKKEWTQAIVVAQKLMQGPCDCAQRVWLKNFIEMGNYAISDSVDQYHGTAKLMATLGRNDNEAMALSSHKTN